MVPLLSQILPKFKVIILSFFIRDRTNMSTAYPNQHDHRRRCCDRRRYPPLGPPPSGLHGRKKIASRFLFSRGGRHINWTRTWMTPPREPVRPRIFSTIESFGASIDRSFDRLIERSFNRLIHRSIDCSIDQSIEPLIEWSIDLSN